MTVSNGVGGIGGIGGKQETIATIFRRARGNLSLRQFTEKLDNAVAYTSLARIERGEVEMPCDQILAAISPYTKPYKSVLELKVIAALGAEALPTTSYEQILALAQGLSNADRVRLIKALVEDLGRP